MKTIVVVFRHELLYTTISGLHSPESFLAKTTPTNNKKYIYGYLYSY